MQGVEPWSEHGPRRAFYMFSRSWLSRTRSRSAYLACSVSPEILSRESEARSGKSRAVSTLLGPQQPRIAEEERGECLIYSEIRQPWHTMYCQLLFSRFFERRPSTNSVHAYTRDDITPSKPVIPKFKVNHRDWRKVPAPVIIYSK